MTRRRTAVTTASVLIVALVAASAFLGWRLWSASRLDHSRTEASAAGRAALSEMLSYDYKSLDQDVERAKARLTPDFATQFQQVVDQTVRTRAQEDEVTTSATVPAVSVLSATPDRVRLLTYVNQLTSYTKKDNEVAYSRVTLTMTKSGDRWLVADMRPV